ncbi:FAD-dependent monooxygenase [Candidatus Parcubacteria bacterium]|nr:FAD-dependent monooxygenase [Candidatus Parcubacteria bacterium]
MNKESLNNEYDIIIVGAGPAGCCVAKFLSNEYNILMIDRSRLPRDRSCGGLMVEEAQDFIKDWKLPKSVFSYPKYLDLKMIDWNNDLEIDIKKKLWNVSRKDFDYWLLKKSQNDVQFSFETKFLQFEKKRKNIEILLEINNKRKVIKTKYLIGANGPFSNIRNSLVKKPMRHYVAAQYWLKHKNIYNSAYFIYDNEITDFYSWIIQKKDNLILGSALEKDSNIKNKMRILRNKFKKKFNITGNVFKKEFAILSRPENKKDIFLGNDKIFLVGESAGFISPSTGEGISFAMRSGYNCAKALNENFEKPFSLYKEFSENLINEIKRKIDKSNALSDPEKRVEMFK